MSIFLLIVLEFSKWRMNWIYWETIHQFIYLNGMLKKHSSQVCTAAVIQSAQSEMAQNMAFIPLTWKFCLPLHVFTSVCASKTNKFCLVPSLIGTKVPNFGIKIHFTINQHCLILPISNLLIELLKLHTKFYLLQCKNWIFPMVCMEKLIWGIKLFLKTFEILHYC